MTEVKKIDSTIKAAMEIPDDCEHGDECGAKHLESLSRSFSESARRWEMVVYPTLFAFILLAAYGFYLIYSLTSDAHKMSENMAQITESMKIMTVEMQSVSRNMVVMSQLMDNQSRSMNQMASSMHNMQYSVARMGYDFSIMNQNVSRPMSVMNSFMPW